MIVFVWLFVFVYCANKRVLSLNTRVSKNAEFQSVSAKSVRRDLRPCASFSRPAPQSCAGWAPTHPSCFACNTVQQI